MDSCWNCFDKASRQMRIYPFDVPVKVYLYAGEKRIDVIGCYFLVSEWD